MGNSNSLRRLVRGSPIGVVGVLISLLIGLGALVSGQAENDRLTVLDSVIETSIQNHETPGAVLLVGHDGKIIYR